MNEPQESDWKKFRAMLPVWRERYLAERNYRIAAILMDPKKTETVRFWDAEKLIRKEACILARCLDDIRRSSMWERLLEMRAAKMILREDLAEFSAELQGQTFYDDAPRKANQSPAPTSGTVTNRAGARSAPVPPVAHL